jgi:hypothetical protein
MLRDALITGSIVCGVTLAAAALCGARKNGNAVAPINATSHVLWGDEAARAGNLDAKHTISGVALNEGASVFWGAIYERAFGRRAEQGEWTAALAGGGVIAALAYLVDYHLVSRRLTPGWEHHLDGRSLLVVYVALAASLPLRGLLRRARR